MDLDKLTIPPELFYPKINKADQLKRKYLSAAPTIKETTPRIRKKVLRKKRNEGPRLGRINHDFLRAVKAKKKLVKKTLRKEAKQEKKFARIYLNNSENTAPNNLSTSQVSLTSPNNVEQRLSTSLIKPSLIKVAPSVAQKTYEKQIKRQEKEQRQMLFVEEDFEPNRMSGGSFKFFKTKNSRPDGNNLIIIVNNRFLIF